MTRRWPVIGHEAGRIRPAPATRSSPASGGSRVGQGPFSAEGPLPALRPVPGSPIGPAPGERPPGRSGGDRSAVGAPSFLDRSELRSTVFVPPGEFRLGEGEDAHRVCLSGFHIARYPVVNALFAEFVRATGREPPAHWRAGSPPPGLAHHPVVHVSWQDAVAYCRWRSEQTGRLHRLSTEAEWERAARGAGRDVYPWGDRFEPGRANTWEAGVGRTTPVDAHPEGRSPDGVGDLVGNVWEWCSSLFRDYPYRADDGREDPGGEGWRVLRGGSWLDAAWGARPARRLGGPPDRGRPNAGFRLVREPSGREARRGERPEEGGDG